MNNFGCRFIHLPILNFILGGTIQLLGLALLPYFGVKYLVDNDSVTGDAGRAWVKSSWQVAFIQACVAYHIWKIPIPVMHPRVWLKICHDIPLISHHASWACQSQSLSMCCRSCEIISKDSQDSNASSSLLVIPLHELTTSSCLCRIEWSRSCQVNCLPRRLLLLFSALTSSPSWSCATNSSCRDIQRSVMDIHWLTLVPCRFGQVSYIGFATHSLHRELEILLTGICRLGLGCFKVREKKIVFHNDLRDKECEPFALPV